MKKYDESDREKKACIKRQLKKRIMHGDEGEGYSVNLFHFILFLQLMPISRTQTAYPFNLLASRYAVWKQAKEKMQNEERKKSAQAKLNLKENCQSFVFGFFFCLRSFEVSLYFIDLLASFVVQCH